MSRDQVATTATDTPLHLPGLGPALATTLERRLGSGGLREALERRDVAALAAVPGVGQRRALKWISTHHGLPSMDDLLATPEAHVVWNEVMDRLLACAATDAGRDTLRLLHPLTDAEAASAHAATVMDHAAMVAQLDDPDAVAANLARIHAPTTPTPRVVGDLLIVCETEALQDDLYRRGLDRWVEIAGPEALRHAEDRGLVILLYDDGIDVSGLEHVLELPADSGDAAIAPHAVLAWFSANADLVTAMANLEAATGDDGPATAAAALLADLPPPPPRRGVDAVQAARAEDDVLQRDVQCEVADLSLSGSDLMAAMQQRLPRPVADAVGRCVGAANQRLADATGLTVDAWSRALPPVLDTHAVEAAQRAAANTAAASRHEAMARVAARLARLIPGLTTSANHWLAFDARFALGRFATQYQLRPATWGDHLAVQDSVHLALADDAAAQRIGYHIGQDAADVALLTGANSGGKSTLLEHLAQVAIMARVGLPVVGRCTAPWLDAIHLVTPRRGLDAGAFETFLRGFLPLADAPGRNLVLADELEATTELEAAGRILGFWIDRVAGRGNLTVLVSHVARQVLQHVTKAVRVDGIEATGLDDQQRLVVARCPRMGHFARSTPELIVQRLAATTSGDGQHLYQELAAAFRASDPLDSP